jgi:predicted amidophosphoribosyltransferase
MEENTVLTGQTCQKCGRNVEKPCTTCNKKSKEDNKKCDKCEKAKKGFAPYAIFSIIMAGFLAYGIYKGIVDIIGLFTN